VTFGPNRRIASLIVLVALFVTGSGMHGSGPAWIAHELDHEMTFASADHVHAGQGNSVNEGLDSPRFLSDGEHGLLHALGHWEACPGPSFNELCVAAIRSGPPSAPPQVVVSADPAPSIPPPRTPSPT
jgi:hypothetical protein